MKSLSIFSNSYQKKVFKKSVVNPPQKIIQIPNLNYPYYPNIKITKNSI